MSYRSTIFFAVLLICGWFCGGCASYATPGRGAQLQALSPETRQALTAPGIQAALDKKPFAALPTSIAIVRLEGPGYRSATAQGWGQGAFTVVTTRDVEKDAEIEKLEKLPMVRGIAPLNRLLLPANLNSDLDLRQAAAQLHADMLLVYTLDTTFEDQDMAAPLSIITLGLSPSRKTRVVTTASAVLMDTRNGYIYGIDEVTRRKTGLATSWNTTQAIDDSRLKTETEAFEQLVDAFAKTWSGVVKQNAAGAVSQLR